MTQKRNPLEDVNATIAKHDKRIAVIDKELVLLENVISSMDKENARPFIAKARVLTLEKQNKLVFQQKLRTRSTRATRIGDAVEVQILMDGLNLYEEEQLNVLPLEAARNINKDSNKNEEKIARMELYVNDDEDFLEKEDEENDAYYDAIMKKKSLETSLPSNTKTNNNNTNTNSRNDHKNLYNEIMNW